MYTINNFVKMNKYFFVIVITISEIMKSVHCDLKWDHAVDLNEDYRLYWTINEPDIVFEVHVRTHGYVGFGFSRDGTIYGADMIIGWVDQKHTFFHDRHINKHSERGEPIVDPSQDYLLMSGHENVTHTILRFRRKLDTCDVKFDVPITNDTMKIIFMYHDEEPKRGSVAQGSLPDPLLALRHPVRPLLLVHRVPNERTIGNSSHPVDTFDVRNRDVLLPRTDEGSLRWCKIIRLKDVKKHHIIRYEPVFNNPQNMKYISYMVVYECKKSADDLVLDDRDEGQLCQEHVKQDRQCSSTVATWARGSEGFIYPKDVGYPLDTSDVNNYMLEVHYEPVPFTGDSNGLMDSSGIRFYHTPVRRKYDAGILSIGIEPEWQHIIPPGYKRVVSEGHCVGQCNRNAFPPTGINIFGVMMRTHQIGRSVKVRLVRGNEELEPIAQDTNIDSEYLEYRRLNRMSKAMPDDHLIVECSYDSYSRAQFTLGGYSAQEEICLATLLYYPRQEKLTICRSKPYPKYVLQSLSIEQLTASAGNQPLIKLPERFAGLTLEEHLKRFDWKNQFAFFDKITKTSPFMLVCKNSDNALITPLLQINNSGHPANITKRYRPPESFCNRSRDHDDTSVNNDSNDINNSLNEYTSTYPIDEDDQENIIEGAARSKVSRSSTEFEKLGLSSVCSTFNNQSILLALLLMFIAKLL